MLDNIFCFCFLFFEISHLFPLPLPVSNRLAPFEVWHSHCHPLKLLILHLHPPPLFNSSVMIGNPISHMGIRRWVRPGLARSILCGGFLLPPGIIRIIPGRVPDLDALSTVVIVGHYSQ